MTAYDIFSTPPSHINSRSGPTGGPVYTSAREGTGNAVLTVATSSATTTTVGQYRNSAFLGGPGYFECDETFLVFDLSEFVSITSVTLALAVFGDQTATDFVIEARSRAWTTPLDSTDYIAGSALGADTLVATYDTASGLTVGSYFNLVDVALLAHCPPGGVARFALSSSRQRLNVAPTDLVGEYAILYATSPKPKLIVDGVKGTPGWSIGRIAF